jgi:hypothetical protein
MSIKRASDLFKLIRAFMITLTSLAGITSAQEIKQDSFPVPTGNPKMLFYLQRSIDINTIIYEANTLNDGSLYEDMPLNIYWIDYADGGVRSSLTKAQRMYAYGIRSRIIDKKNQVYLVNLVSYKTIEILIRPVNEQMKFQAFITINGKTAILRKIFINIIGGSMYKPVISYIRIYGYDAVTGLEINEKIIPVKRSRAD